MIQIYELKSALKCNDVKIEEKDNIETVNISCEGLDKKVYHLKAIIDNNVKLDLTANIIDGHKKQRLYYNVDHGNVESLDSSYIDDEIGLEILETYNGTCIATFKDLNLVTTIKRNKIEWHKKIYLSKLDENFKVALRLNNKGYDYFVYNDKLKGGFSFDFDSLKENYGEEVAKKIRNSAINYLGKEYGIHVNKTSDDMCEAVLKSLVTVKINDLKEKYKDVFNIDIVKLINSKRITKDDIIHIIQKYSVIKERSL